ncbi:MAG: hypothetical protein BJ554DRAFT_2101, partial [Olpidium bornovanus]
QARHLAIQACAVPRTPAAWKGAGFAASGLKTRQSYSKGSPESISINGGFAALFPSGVSRPVHQRFAIEAEVRAGRRSCVVSARAVASVRGGGSPWERTRPGAQDTFPLSPPDATDGGDTAAAAAAAAPQEPAAATRAECCARCRLTFANGGGETAAEGHFLPPAGAAAAAAAAAAATTARPGRAKATPAELRSLRADADAAADGPRRQAEPSSFSIFGALMRRSASVASIASSTLSYITGADQGWDDLPDGEGDADAPPGAEAAVPHGGGGSSDDVPSALPSAFLSATEARAGGSSSSPPDCPPEIPDRKAFASPDSSAAAARRAGEPPLPPRPPAPRQRESGAKCNILWCYVQIVGSFCVDPTIVKAQMLQALNSKVMYSRSGSRYGGGGMLEAIEPNRQASSSATGAQSAAGERLAGGRTFQAHRKRRGEFVSYCNPSSSPVKKMIRNGCPSFPCPQHFCFVT